MRPLNEQQQRLLKHPAGYTVRGRVRVLGPDDAWHDLTNLFERDFLEGVDVDESLDSPVGQATVRVLREVRGVSLAPLMTSSRANNLGVGYAPLLDPPRLFRVEVALGPPRQLATSPEWLPLFAGRIDNVDSGNPDVITFVGRDMGGVLQDVWTAEEKTYGSDAGVPLETVCNTILTDAQLPEFALYTPEASTQALGKYKQDYEPVINALTKLAAGRGWEVRWKFRPDTGDWGLWLWGPDRAATTPVWTYTANDYEHLGELSVGLEDIRTVVEVVYPDASDLDTAGQPKRKTERRESATALARYGYLNSAGTRLHRLMRVVEGAATNLRSAAEAGRLADAGLADLSTTDVGASVEVLLHPGLELGDLVALAANSVNFSSEQRLAVRQVTHRLSSTSGRTALRLLGKPALGPRAWLSMEARPGLNPSSPFTGPAAPSGLTVTNSVTGAVLLFTAPNLTSGGPAAEEYELHVGTSPGFTLSSSTLKAVSSSTRFDVTGLVAGVPYYARVRSRDRRGNVGPASAEVALAPRYVSPGVLLPKVTVGSLPLNGELEALTDAGQPPDTVTLSGGIWGSDVTTSTDSYAGVRSILFPAGMATATLYWQVFTVREGEQWVFSTWFKQGTAGVRSGTLGVNWLSSLSGAVDFSSEALGGASTPANSWQRGAVSAAVPAGARYAEVLVEKWSGYAGALTVDSVDALRQQAFEPWQDVTWQNDWLPYNIAVFGLVRYRKNDAGEVWLKGTAGAPSPAPAANSTLFTLPSGYRPGERRLWATSTGTALVDVEVRPDGTVRVPSIAAGGRVPLDMVRFQADF
ncbi:fibronectin type III domain-containing protein [Archangium lansingense]|uniref:Fibronectin type III domain-containing protein n=1 Tax=Archangium lansingense TaxID=2995310 RepID=A0ABT4AHD0_9BACT|nr:fibronectin type III domain-containing protein [Archangium lansinium]MCY1080304.1 fibronectin type III domain-containing protein [Archangium lansinium]